MGEKKMNKYQIAYNYLLKRLGFLICENLSEWIAIRELVEKTIPVKPVEILGGKFACPNDMETIRVGYYFNKGFHTIDYRIQVKYKDSDYIIARLDYCGTCGQALDWSDNK